MTMKVLNPKATTMMIALSSFLGAFKECYGASQLFGLESIVYEDSHGFPTTIAIGYESDLPAVDTQESASDDGFYFKYDISGSGASYYSTDESSLTVVNTETIQIDLIENEIIPVVGIYTVSIRVELMLKHPTYEDPLIHAKTYELTVEQLEATVDLEISNEGPYDFGDDIVCNIVETADTPYNVWLDTSNPIQVFSDYKLENKILDWTVGSIVATADNEDEATDSLAVTLQNIPENINNGEPVYVKVAVMFREVAGEALSTPQEEDGGLRRRLRALQTNSEGSATLETEVNLVPYDEGTESTSNTHHVQQQYSEGSATLGTMVSLEPYEEEIVSVTNTFALQRPSFGSADFVTTVHFGSDIARSSNNLNVPTSGQPGENRIQKVRFHSSAKSSDTTKDPLVVGLAVGVAAGGIALILLLMFFCHLICKNQNGSETKDEGSEGDESTLDGSIADKASISSANNTLAEF